MELLLNYYCQAKGLIYSHSDKLKLFNFASWKTDKDSLYNHNHCYHRFLGMQMYWLYGRYEFSLKEYDRNLSERITACVDDYNAIRAKDLIKALIL